MASAARILWTKQLTKKHKTWNDGFILVKANGSACLYDEDGKEIASCIKLPGRTDITADDNINCFDGYIVQGDCACNPDDIKRVKVDTDPDNAYCPNMSVQGCDVQVQQVAQPATLAPCLSRHKRSTCAAVRQQRPSTQIQACPTETDTSASPIESGWIEQAGSACVETSITQRPISKCRTVCEISCLLDSLAPAGGSRITWGQQQAQQDLPAAPQLGRLSRPRRSQQKEQQQAGTISKASEHQHVCNTSNWGPESCSLPTQVQQHRRHLSRQQLPPATGQQQRWHTITGAAKHRQQSPTQHVSLNEQQQDWQSATGSSTTYTAAATAGNAEGPCWRNEDMSSANDEAHIGRQQCKQQQQEQVLCAQENEQQQRPGYTAAKQKHPGFKCTSSDKSTASHNRWQCPQPPAAVGISTDFNISRPNREPLQPLPVRPQLQSRSVPGPYQQPDTAAGDVAAKEGCRWQQLQKASTFKGPRMAAPVPANLNAATAAGQPYQQQQVSLQDAVDQPLPPALPRRFPTGMHCSARQPQQQQQMVHQYQFPAAGSPQLQRHVVIPTEFSTAAGYITALLGALHEEVNLKLAEHVKTFHSLTQQAAGIVSGQLGPRPPKQKQRQQHDHKQQGSCSQLQSLCGRHGLQYCPSSTLTVYQRSQSTITAWAKGKSKKRRKKGGKWMTAADEVEDEGDEDDAEEQQQQVKQISMYLTLGGKIDRRRFRKHDLWVLSNDPKLNTASATGLGDRWSKPWTLIAKALWHGPDKDGKMEVEVLPGQVPAHHKWPRQQEVAALLAPDLATEVQVADFLRSGDTADWPFIKHLLHEAQVKSADRATAAAAATGVNSDRTMDLNSSGQQDQYVNSSHSSDREQGDSNTGDGPSTAAADVLEASMCGNLCASGSSSDNDSDGLNDLMTVDHVQPSKKRRAAAAAGTTASIHAKPPLNPEAALQVRIQDLLDEVTQRFHLNPAQAQVAAHVSEWLPELIQQQSRTARLNNKSSMVAGVSSNPLPGTSSSAGNYSSVKAAAELGLVNSSRFGSQDSTKSKRPPICLIHGPFGSGKSTLLVALIHLLTGLTKTEQQQATDGTSRKRKTSAGSSSQSCPRILVAAHTNVAVDRVLLALMQTGFTNMLRVGSLQRIDKRLLCHSLHSADDKRDALSQLQSMLQEAQGAEAEMIKAEIAEVKAGAEKQRRRRLATAAVVGVTCCAALQATLEGQHFDIVVLDEASQMTEPTSLVPLVRVKPSFLIAAGDPCQLPPVLATPAAVSAPPAGGLGSGSNSRLSSEGGQQHQQQLHGLQRTLFVRLTHLGHVPHLLTHQYRCHPALSALSNKHFYNSRLLNGVTAEQRAAMIPGLAPLVLCDCQGGRAQFAGEAGGRSSVNKAEAQMVVQLVLAVLRCRKASDEMAVQEQMQQQQQRLRQPVAAGEGTGDLQKLDDGMDAFAAEVNEPLQQEQPQQQVGHPEDGDVAVDDETAAIDAPAVFPHQLGVICFFRGQAALLKQMLAAEAVHCPGAADVQVATVDSFQGAEKEVIILATTTTNPRSEFCGDAARLNVALTRAKRHLLVVGAADVLSQAPGAVLRDLVLSCRGAGCCYVGSSMLALPGLSVRC